MATTTNRRRAIANRFWMGSALPADLWWVEGVLTVLLLGVVLLSLLGLYYAIWMVKATNSRLPQYPSSAQAPTAKD